MDENTTRAPTARAASTTSIVPRTFTSASWPGSSTETRTSACAARWNTASGRKSATSVAQAGRRADVELVELGRGGHPLALAGREIVDHRHAVAAREQRVGDVGADEAGARR